MSTENLESKEIVDIKIESTTSFLADTMLNKTTENFLDIKHENTDFKDERMYETVIKKEIVDSSIEEKAAKGFEKNCKREMTNNVVVKRDVDEESSIAVEVTKDFKNRSGFEKKSVEDSVSKEVLHKETEPISNSESDSTLGIKSDAILDIQCEAVLNIKSEPLLFSDSDSSDEMVIEKTPSSLSTNLKEKNFACLDCSKKFSQRKLLNRHLNRVHSKEKKYSCQQCSEKFYQKVQLDKHKSTAHVKLKKYSCQECDQSFTFKPDLYGHLQSVHFKEEQNFNCLLCHQTFNQIGLLENHTSAVHLKIKRLEVPISKDSYYRVTQYGCMQCSQVFNDKYDLHMHVLNVHTQVKRYNFDISNKAKNTISSGPSIRSINKKK